MGNRTHRCVWNPWRTPDVRWLFVVGASFFAAPAFASFNYIPPPMWMTAAAVVGGLAAVLVLVFLRSVVLGFIGGALICGGLAFFVTGAGSGDMTELVQPFNALVFGGIGALVSARGAAMAKTLMPKRTVQITSAPPPSPDDIFDEPR